MLEELYLSIGENLSTTEKNAIHRAFVNYFLGENLGVYSNQIYSFIIKNKDNEILKNISNGIIFYDGLRYCNSFENKHWEKMYIFLNMEIIFHLMGYNGEFFKQIVEELIDLIVDINKKNKVIFLRYTRKERKRIEDFFVALRNDMDPTKTEAAREIINKCNGDKLRVRKEEKEVYSLLENYCVIEEEIEIKDDIKEKDIFKTIRTKLEITNDEGVRFDEINDGNTFVESDEILSFLINLILLRGNNPQTIESAKYLFLTEESCYIKMANLIKKHTKHEIPVAVRLSYLTNIFWLKLGKAFSSKKTPIISQADARAKISVALKLGENMSSLYEEIIRRKDEFDEKMAKELLYDIKSSNKKPESIDKENIDSTLALSGADLTFFLERRKKREEKLETMGNEIRNLKKEKDEIEAQKQALSQELNDVGLEKEKLQRQLNEEKARRKQREKEERDKDMRRQILFCRFKQFGSILLVLIIASCIYIFLPKKWLEHLKDLLFIFGLSGLGISGFLIWLYTHFNKKIRNMQEQTEEEK